MDTTILVVEQLRDRQTADRLRHLLDGEPGVAGVVALEERGEPYVKHNPAHTPYIRLLERLEGEGYRAHIKLSAARGIPESYSRKLWMA